jgi:hypothetical protein
MSSPCSRRCSRYSRAARDPDVHEPLEPARGKVRECRVPAELRGVAVVAGLREAVGELEALAELLRQPRKLIRARERTEGNASA